MKELVANQTFQFYFYGEVIQAALAEDRNIYVPIHAISERLDLDARGQQRRLFESEQLMKELARIDMPTEYRGRIRMRPTSCINILAIPIWLDRIDINRIAENARDDVRRIKNELHIVAKAYSGTSIIPKELFDELTTHERPEMQAIFNGMHELKAMLLSLGEQVGMNLSRLNEIEKQVIGLIGEIDEEKVINPQQALHIQAMVNALADILDKKGKANAHSHVYGMLKKQFNINRYGALPRAKYEEAVRFLTSWCRRLLKPGQTLPSVFARGDQRELFD